MFGLKAMLPSTLADRPVADRRGDDRLARDVHHVAHPADIEAATPAPTEATIDDQDAADVSAALALLATL